MTSRQHLVRCNNLLWSLESRNRNQRVDSYRAETQQHVSAKISALFTYREIFRVAKYTLPKDHLKHWCVTACAIQSHIYQLDFCYEQSEKIQRPEEDLLWSGLENCIRTGEGSRSESLWSGLADLRLYSEVESRIHAFDLIDVREFATVVRLKCADVRMARSLIGFYARSPFSSRLSRFWDLYDQCWELLEDLTDVGEDGLDWNFNFWLYAFMSGQDMLAGCLAAAITLRGKLYQLEQAYCGLPSVEQVHVTQSFRRTVSCGAWWLNRWWLPMRAIRGGIVRRFSEQRWQKNARTGRAAISIESGQRPRRAVAECL